MYGEFTAESLSSVLESSAELGALIRAAWDSTPLGDAPRKLAVRGLCAVSIDHGAAVLSLLADFPASGVVLVRPQYESLVRAVWAAHAATDSDLARLLAPLSQSSQQSAKRLPGVPQMIEDLETHGPPGSAALLARARSRLGDGLNSFIHAGIHPFARQREGYPVALLVDVAKNSNALSMLTLLVLATASERKEVVGLLQSLHTSFSAVLPALEPL